MVRSLGEAALIWGMSGKEAVEVNETIDGANDGYSYYSVCGIAWIRLLYIRSFTHCRTRYKSKG
jgi:hypothetical protein